METAIKEYSATEAALAELRTRLKDVKYEVTTTAGMDTAKKDRRELVTLRTSLEAKRKEIKAPALDRCRMIDDEAKRITTELLALETPIDQQIKAEEARKEEERAEKARQAAAAQKILDDKILEIGKLPLRCIGMSAEGVKLFLETITSRELGGEFTGETRERAEAVRKAAVEEITTIHTAMVEAEEKAAAIKAEQEAEAARQEVERKEREEAARKLAEGQETLRLEREAFEKEQAEQRRKQEEDRAEQERIEREKREIEEARIRAEKEEADRKQREKEAEERKVAEEKAAAEELARKKAEKEKREAERLRKLAEARCQNATDAFAKILAICQSEEHTDTGKVTQIALIAEANL